MTIAEFKALSSEERDTTAREQKAFWMDTIELNRQHAEAETPEEKAVKITKFQTLVDGADLIS